MEFTSRTKLLLGEEKLSKIASSNICVFGCGGVGGYVIEMLVRIGVKNLTIVDFDKVDITNINRQIIATSKTVGQYKVNATAVRAKEINPDINIVAVNKRFCEENLNQFNLEAFDFIIDAIDSVPDKVLLIKLATQQGIKIVSAMGAGNKIGIPSFQICDIYKTENDGLAKKMRKLLRDAGVKKLDVCCAKEKSIPQKEIGSIAYYPAVAGSIIASFVVNEIIGKGE